MKKCICLMAMGLGLTVLGAVPQAITYRGVLRRAGGGAPGRTLLEMAFRLYESGVDSSGRYKEGVGKPLWGRTMVVPVDFDASGSNGTFYVELRDDAGGFPLDIDRNAKLVDVLAAMKNWPELGLTPLGPTQLNPLGSTQEIKPRQKLEVGVRAVRAVQAHAADAVACKSNVALDGVRVCELAASRLTARNLSVLGNGKCTFSTTESRTVGGGNATVTVGGVRPNDDAATVGSAYQGAYTTEAAPCDMALTYSSENFGAFSVIVPKGGIVSDGAPSGSASSVKSMTQFANKMK